MTALLHRNIALAGALAAAFAVVFPAPAYAYEDQYSLDLELGYGGVFADEQPTSGIFLGAGFAWGLNDAWTLRFLTRYDVHPASTPLHVATAGTEVLYLLDILTFVPFVGVGVNGVLSAHDGNFSGELALHAVVGIDWLLSRSLILGLDIRPHVLPLSFTDEGIDPFYLTMGVRLSVVFDRY